MDKKPSLLLPLFVFVLSAFLAGSTIDIAVPLNDRVETGGAPNCDAGNSPESATNKSGPRETVVDSVQMPTTTTPHMGIGFDGMYLWMLDNTPPVQLTQFDTIDGTIINQITNMLGSYCHGVTFLNGSLWIQEWQTSGTVYEIDPNTGSTISSFTSPGGTGSRGLTNDGANLWCFATGGGTSSGTAYQLTTTGALLHSCDISAVMQWPTGASYNTQRGTFFVNDNGTENDINELDCSGPTAVLISQCAHPDAGNVPEGITYDGQFLWTHAAYSRWVWKIDIGDPPPPPPENILFVDDDADQTYETFWETSFANLAYPFDKWVVADSSDAAPDSAAMSNYTIVVWTTAADYLNTLTPTDTTEMGKWLAAGGKLWLSSQDVLFDIGTAVSWMHLSGYNGDVSCDSALGIGPVMNGTAFYTTGAAFADFTDELISDGVSRAEVLLDYADTNAVAIDTSAGEPYFVFFNAFGWENINTEADRDTMMERVLSWMGYAPPSIDAAAQAINWPGTSVLIEANDFPSATFRNAGKAPITFDVHFEIDTSGSNVYTGNVQSIYLDVGASTTWIFAPDWTAGSNEGMVYDVMAYTVMPGDDDASNDTIMQTTITTSVSDWIRCANRPTAEMCHATTYDPVDDCIYNFGGYRGDNTYCNWTYRYDPVSDSWTSLTGMPTAIDWIDASVTAWNRSIYVFGGFNAIPNDFNYIYDIPTDSWSTGTNLPVARCGGGQVVYNDSLIYMLGGFDANINPSSNVQIYDTYTDSWTVGTPLPVADMMHGCAILGDTIWLVGGYSGSPCTMLYFGVINPSNCETIAWSTGSALPCGELFNNGAAMMYRCGSGLLYTVGGLTGLNGSDITDEAWEYNVGLDTWTALPYYPMTLARNDFLVARTSGDTMELYVAGGDNSGYWTETNQTWKLKWQPSGVQEEKTLHAPVFGLARTAPNPVSNGATIAYTTTQEGPVSLRIYDASGRLIRTLVDAIENAGRKTVRWDGRDNHDRAVAAGVYFYRLTAEDKTASQKMVVVR